VLLNDELSPAFAAEIRPYPLPKDAEPQAIFCQELYVNQTPDEPRKETTHLNSSGLEHREILTYNRQIALIEVTEWRQRGFLCYVTKYCFGSIGSLLHGDLRDAGQRAAVLIERSRISDDKNLRVLW